MKKLTAYDKESAETLKLIYEAKEAKLKLGDSRDEYEVKELIKNKYNIIVKRYKDYCDYKNRLEDINIGDFSELEKKALIHCYEHSTNTLSKLKKDIKLSQSRALRSICIYCGINNPGTYDHYVPKSQYPEYSVYGPNLIPCCGECNSKKGEHWKSKDKKRLFLNFYYDSIPDLQIIKAIIIIEDDEPKIRFEFIESDGCFEYEKLENSFTTKSHFTRLNLLDRYKECCNSYIDEIINSLSAHKNYDEKSIIEFLSQEHVGLVKTYGINHWKSVAIKGMLDSSDFIKYCTRI